MVRKLFNNIVNRVTRTKNKFSLRQKSRAQHSSFRQGRDLNAHAKDQSVPQKTLWPAWLKIKPQLIISLLLLALVGVIVYQVVMVVTALTKFQTKPYTLYTTNPTIEGTTTKLDWQGNTKLTVVLVGTDKLDSEHIFVDALGIYTLDPVDNKLSVFMINPDLRVYVSTIGKDVNFRTVFTDPKLPKDRMAVLKNAVSALLAVRVDRYIVVDKADFAKYTALMNPVKVVLKQDVADLDTANLPAKKYINWKKGAQSISGDSSLEFLASDVNGRNDQLDRQQSFFSSLPFEQLSLATFLNLPLLINKFPTTFYTDLGNDELLSIIQKALDLKEDAVKKGYTRAESYQQVNSTSFYPVFLPILDRVDEDINNIFFDLKIFKEHARIEVLNSSNISGLANSRSRWISNLGARVIKIGNGFGSSATTKIYCSEPDKYPFTMTELNRIFNFKAQLIKQDYPNRHIGDVIVELGNTYE